MVDLQDETQHKNMVVMKDVGTQSESCQTQRVIN